MAIGFPTLGLLLYRVVMPNPSIISIHALEAGSSTSGLHSTVAAVTPTPETLKNRNSGTCPRQRSTLGVRLLRPGLRLELHLLAWNPKWQLHCWAFGVSGFRVSFSLMRFLFRLCIWSSHRSASQGMRRDSGLRVLKHVQFAKLVS